MQRAHGVSADNAFATALIVPGSRKFEVISSRIGLTGSGGSIVAQIAVVGGTNYLVDGNVSTPAHPAFWALESNGVCLEAGDHWLLGVFGNGADWAWYVTYVDVGP